MNRRAASAVQWALLLLIFLCAFTADLRANGGQPVTYLVNSLRDDGTGSGTTGTLRYCLNQANATGATATITFNIGGTITLTQGELPIKTSARIRGPGADQLAIDAHHASRIFTHEVNTAVTISGLLLINGKRDPDPNKPQGGGIVSSRGTLNVRDCALTGHQGAAISIESDPLEPGSANLTVLNCLIADNDNADNSGGGIFSSGRASILNSTLSGNKAGRGGAIYNVGTMTVKNCTFAENLASGSIGDSIYNVEGLRIDNTIIEESRESSIGSTDTVTTGGGNVSNRLVFDGFGTQVADLKLGPLAYNGGPTKTHALLGGSPAIDAGDNALIPQDGEIDPPNSFPVATDQRGEGYSRIAIGYGSIARVDSGAFEADGLTTDDYFFLGGKKWIDMDIFANDIAPENPPALFIGLASYGTVTRNEDGTVRYTPNRAFPPEGDYFSYSFAGSSPGRRYHATVYIRNVLGFAGRFDGLLAETSSSRAIAPGGPPGYVQLTVARSGRFTGKVTIRSGASRPSEVCTVSGLFDERGRYQGTVRSRFGKPTIDLQLDQPKATIVGTFSGDYQSMFTATVISPAGKFAGRFTMLMDPPAPAGNGPSYGTGYATINVAAAGDVRVVGKLADNLTLTTGTLLHPRSLALFAILYRKGVSLPDGHLAGELIRAAGLVSNAGGSLHWLKPERANDDYFPAGIDLTLNGRMVRYTLPVQKGNALESTLPPATAAAGLSLRGTPVTTETVTIDSNSKVTFLSANPQSLKLTLREPNGSLTGTFTHPTTGKLTSLTGLALQGEERAGGFFLNPETHDSGSIFITTTQ